MFVGLHFLYLWLPRWLWAEAILWWLEKSDSSIWGRSGGLLPPRGYPNYPCFVQISRQRHLSASSERPKTCGHCVLAQRYCCQKSSHTTLESYTLSVTCQVRTTFFYVGVIHKLRWQDFDQYRPSTLLTFANESSSQCCLRAPPNLKMGCYYI